MKEENFTKIIEKEIVKEMPETIVILGAPGSGKDTQASFLVEALGYQIISTGELLRILADHDDSVKAMMEKGELIPDDVVEDELISAFILLPERQPVILDGYPRNLSQAQKLDKILEENNRKLDRVVYINIDDNEAIKRIGRRRICSRCGKIQIENELCEKCGAKTELRLDDQPEAVKKRLEIFHEAMQPVIEFYRERGILREVDGNPPPDQVRELIRSVL